jgi:hypothetical protein
VAENACLVAIQTVSPFPTWLSKAVKSPSTYTLKYRVSFQGKSNVTGRVNQNLSGRGLYIVRSTACQSRDYTGWAALHKIGVAMVNPKTTDNPPSSHVSEVISREFAPAESGSREATVAEER